MAAEVLNSSSVFRLNFCAKLNICASISATSPSRKTLTPGQKKEYILWVSDAKTDATRNKRIETTVLWCSERKRRLWKYESC